MSEIYENYTTLESISEDQNFFSYGYAMNNQDICSPFYESQGTTNINSPMSTVLSSLSDSEFLSLNNAVETPYITILEQPVDKFRFRYKSEMVGTHGSLMGSNNNNNRRKNAPTVQLHKYPGNAIIRCTLVTSDEHQRIPHPHKLVHRDGLDSDDPHDVKVSAENEYIATFHGMAIIHTAKKYIRDELIRKIKKNTLEVKKRENINATLSTIEEAHIKSDADRYQKYVNLNSVALCFQAFILDQNEIMRPITNPIYSHPINNLKSALTGELKICRIDKHTSSVEGAEEVFILVEKVGKKNIKVKFFELNEDDYEIWCDYGRFSELDVHHQYAIVFRTPPYRDLNITTPKEVFIQLERPSDGDCSEPIKFIYKPSDRVIDRKRKRISHSESSELSFILPISNENENISDILNNSTEIKKILSEGITSPKCKEFLKNMDVDNYLKFFDNEENMLITDGPSTVQNQDDIMFAKNVLTKVIQYMKMDLKNVEEYIQKLFKDRSTYGDSPLHAALRYGQRDIVKYFLMLISSNKDCKALVNGQNSSGKTPLHYAILQNQPEITKALLMLGADPNRTDDHGFSALHTVVIIPTYHIIFIVRIL